MNIMQNLPPWAKQNFNLGNRSNTPPNITEHIAVAVSDGIPKRNVFNV